MILKLTVFVVALHIKIGEVHCSYCNTTSSTLTSYGQPCVHSSNCVTNYCNSLCVCPAGTYFDSCSQTCQISCNSIISSPKSGIISSFGYPYGASNLICSWTVQAPYTNQYVSFKFTDVNVYSCSDLSIYSSNTLLGTVCSLSTMSTYVTDTNLLKITFIHRSTGYRGFRGVYNIYDYAAAVNSETSGVIASPGYPMYGRPYSTPSWLITGGQSGYTTTVSITMSGSYYLNVSSSTRSILVYSSTTVTLDTNSVKITTFSSINYSSAKFYATFSISGKQFGVSCSYTNQCGARFICSGGSCRCENNHFYNQASLTCQQSLIHGIQCSTSTSGMCSVGLECRTDKWGSYRCLCPSNTYFYLGNCYYDTDLSVSLSADSILSTNFMYLKLTCQVRTSVSFNVSWAAVSYSNDNGYNLTNSRDVYVRFLTPNRNYRFNVTTSISSDNYYLSKSIVTILYLETRRLFGGYCSSNSQCDERLTCVGTSCGCVSQQYFHNVSNTCQNRLNKGNECTRTEECKDSLTCVRGFCGCLPGQYYHTSYHSCYYAQSYGALCNISIDGMCRSADYVCSVDSKGLYRCLCPNNTYNNGSLCTERLVDLIVVKEDQIDLTFYSLTGLRNFNITWTAVNNVSDKGWQQVTGNSVRLPRLTPGQEYLFTVSTSLTTESSYESYKSIMTQFPLVTLPAAPGQIWREKSKLNKPPYFIKFYQSRGVVQLYQITIKTGDSKQSLMVCRVTCPEIITSDLNPNTEYFYEITAYNKLGNASLSVSGRFKTLKGDEEDEDNIESSKHVDDQDSPPGWMIAVACIGWVSALALIVAITFICLRKTKKKSAQNSRESNEGTDQSNTYCNVNNATNQNVTLNDYRQCPQATEKKTSKAKKTSQYVNSHIHQTPGSSHVNVTYEHDLEPTVNENNTYEEIGNLQSNNEIYINMPIQK